MRRIFVYGTLLRGGPNHYLLASSTFVCGARTIAKFYMLSNETENPPHDTYKYPYMAEVQLVPSLIANQAAGEVYEIDVPTLARLDDLEGIEYERRRVEVTRVDDAGCSSLECETYVLAHTPTMERIAKSLLDPTKGFKIVPDCDWRAYIGGY